MEYPLWVSRVLVRRKGAPRRQPRQEGRDGVGTGREMNGRCRHGTRLRNGFPVVEVICRE